MLIFKKASLLLLSCSFVAMASHANQTNPLLTVQSPGLNLLSQAELIQPMSPKTKLSFIVWLKLRNEDELTQLAQDVYDANSPRYHQFLTADLYEQEYAPSKEAENTVQQFFSSKGMSAKVVLHSIQVTGTVEQIEKALHVHLNNYQYQHHIVHANAEHPKLNPQIGQYIASISGLNNIPEYHDNNANAQAPDKTVHDLHFIWNNFMPSALPTTISLQGFSGANLQKTYNLSNIPPVNGKHLTGAGQTLIIVDKCGSNGPADILSDANQYFNENNIRPFITTGASRNFAIVNPDGTPFKTCPGTPAYSREIVLDIEASHTIAPGDNTVLVLGTDQKSTLMSVINSLIVNRFTIAGFPNAYVISNSWSSPESYYDTAMEESLKIAAAAGISVDFSSGDCGDNTYNTQTKCTASSIAVNYPSSSAYVTAVGATALFVDSNYRYAFETVWGTVKTISGIPSYTGGTGGGISQYYGPVNWQSSISNFTAGGYGVISNFGNLRALPDVAMLGDPQTGLLIISQGQQVQDGGTSLACPLFSATLVLINEARALLNKGTPIGHAAPYLYRKNDLLLANRALNLIIPPAVMISGATPPPAIVIQGTPAPASAFTISNVTFGWDSSLTLEPEAQYWNDGVGVGSPNIPNFVTVMANL